MSLPDRKKIKELSYIFSRNIFLLTNGVIAVVVALLFVFGDTQAAVFLGFVLVLNMVLGLGQDIRAWLALENLQLLTAPHILRVKDDQSEESVLVEEIKTGDLVKCKTGDQIPCDGIIVHADSLELNEGLITGESTSLPRKEGEQVLAGSIITSGSCVMRAAGIFGESRIARMTEGIKSYSVTQSPIQRAAGMAITYSGYVLIVVILFVVGRGFIFQESNLLIVKEIGALASTMVPQGLAFSMTLLFAYGAAHLFRQNVLLQEVNATEKLGRIKNLCMDKTGTLTENTLVVERMEIPAGATKEDAEKMTAAYIFGSANSSQTTLAIKEFSDYQYSGNIFEALPFSSWTSYGAVRTEEDGVSVVVLAGAPERILPYVRNAEKREWLQKLLDTEAGQGKRVFCVARFAAESIPENLASFDITPLAVFLFAPKLRPGINDAIDFFQKRGTRIRIISGDHPETVRAIATLAGVEYCDKVTTGNEMEQWTLDDFKKYAKEYTIFARTFPEQKEKIIEALKSNGFTAMVGDGANDALAIKKADLGIAMWEGAPATRQIASVVLMNNSFTALPGGVELADSIIKNAEIFASIFFNFAFVGFFLFCIVSIFGYPYPLSPLNITLINYFAVGLPGILVSYWTIRPANKSVAPNGERFLSKVLPFTIYSAVLQVITIGMIFLLSPESMRVSGSDLYVLLASIVVGSIFFFFTPWVYRGVLATTQVRELCFLVIGEIFLLFAVFQLPFLLRFFDVSGTIPPLTAFGYPTVILLIYTILQYFLARFFGNRARNNGL